VQLAALGFIGLCGVLQSGEGSDPLALQALAGILVLLAFLLACLGIFYVGKAAWPIYGPDPAPALDPDEAALERASGELRRGLKLTFASIALVALATTTSWWPTEGGDGAGATVRVQAVNGATFCGELAGTSQDGTLRVLTDAQPIVVELRQIASVRSVGSC